MTTSETGASELPSDLEAAYASAVSSALGARDVRRAGSNGEDYFRRCVRLEMVAAEFLDAEEDTSQSVAHYWAEDAFAVMDTWKDIDAVSLELSMVSEGVISVGEYVAPNAHQLASMLYHGIFFRIREAAGRPETVAEFVAVLFDQTELCVKTIQEFPEWNTRWLEAHLEREIALAFRARLQNPQLVLANEPYSRPDSPSRWARAFNLSLETFQKRVADGTIRAKKLSPKLYRVHVGDLPAG